MATAAMEMERRCLRRREHWVVLPHRSTPSRRMNAPLFVAAAAGDDFDVPPVNILGDDQVYWFGLVGWMDGWMGVPAIEEISCVRYAVLRCVVL